jgi:hypothetical protein
MTKSVRQRRQDKATVSPCETVFGKRWSIASDSVLKSLGNLRREVEICTWMQCHGELLTPGKPGCDPDGLSQRYIRISDRANISYGDQ